MAFKPLNSANLGAFVKRIDALRPDTKRLWGTLEPAGMLAHLSFVLRVTLGEVPVEDKSTFFARNIGSRVVFTDWMPWPKGKIKVPPQFTPAATGSLDEERARLFEIMKRFVEISDREPQRTAIHAIFGPFTLQYWQRVHGKHTNHHCEQFGL